MMYRTTHSGEKFNKYTKNWDKNPNSPMTLNVSYDETEQIIYGFGGAFTDSVVYNFRQIPSNVAQQTVNDILYSY